MPPVSQIRRGGEAPASPPRGKRLLRECHSASPSAAASPPLSGFLGLLGASILNGDDNRLGIELDLNAGGQLQVGDVDGDRRP